MMSGSSAERFHRVTNSIVVSEICKAFSRSLARTQITQTTEESSGKTLVTMDCPAGLKTVEYRRNGRKHRPQKLPNCFLLSFSVYAVYLYF